MYDLDKKDKLILYQLDINSRQTDSEIAKKVRLSRAAVSYRINNLVKKGVIKNFVTLINPSKLNKTIYKLYIKFLDTKSENEQLIKSFLIKHTQVIWVTKCEGSWDMICALWMNESIDFYEFMSIFSSKFNGVISEKEFSTQIEVPFFTRSYLLDKSADIKCIWGGRKSVSNLDKEDVKILTILSINSRMNVVDIAHKTKLTPRIVQYRIKKLLDQKVIIAFSAALNVNQIGYDYYKTIVYLKDIDQKSQLKLFEFCKELGQIREFIRTLGPWELELEWEVKDYKSLIASMSSIRKEFGQYIRKYEHLLISEEYKGEYNILQTREIG